jgi:hypothetical protein
MLMFTSEDHERVANSEITITWRLWKYAHVKAGKVYATNFPFGGSIVVEDVRAVPAGEITDSDAHEVGQPDAHALIVYARSHTGREVSADTLLYRVRFHFDPKDPPKPEYSLDEVAKRLDRLDKASRTGPWTLRALQLIEENPGVVSRELAPEMGMDRADFKLNVRKLKALGLTLSLTVGYELTELGLSYLDSVSSEEATSLP